MLKKFCNKNGCKNMCDAGERYCSEHKKAPAQRNKEYDQSIRLRRDKELSEFYHSREWQAVRLQALMRDNYLCQECLKHNKITHADMVHHKKPIRKYWSLRLDLKYLESLCDACHGKIDHDTLEG